MRGDVPHEHLSAAGFGFVYGELLLVEQHESQILTDKGIVFPLFVRFPSDNTLNAVTPLRHAI